VAVAAILLAVAATGRAQRPQDWDSPPERWLEVAPTPGNRPPTVQGYLDDMAWRTLPREVLLVAGSATARGWDVQKWFSDFTAVNRGFGGSRIDDVTHFANRLIVPFAPSTVLLYAGDNDLWRGKPVDVTVQHLQAFVDTIHAALPDTQVVFVSIRPSPARWEIWGAMQEANARIRTLVDANPNLHYADIVPATLGDDGRPRPELFVEDGLHLTELGYAMWTRVVKPVVREAEARYRQLKGCARCGSLR